MIKKIAVLPLAILIVASALAALPMAFAPPAGTCYYMWSSKGSWNSATNQHEITFPATPNPIGQEFDVEIRVANVTFLRTVGITITWNNSIINYKSYTWGNAFAGSALQFPPTITPGQAAGAGWTYNVGDGYKNWTGSSFGWFLTFTFNVTGVGVDDPVFKISPTDTVMKDFWGAAIAFSAYSCEVTVEQPVPGPPTAGFSWSPIMPEELETVNFDADYGVLSLPGFNGTHTIPITTYYWDWENDGVIDDTTASDTITHVYATAATYTVNLTVYAPDTGGGYYPYDNVTHTITVRVKAMGRVIDVFTDDHRHPCYTTPYTGDGPNEAADAYAPQDNVTLYAEVLYNDWPIQNKPVAFAVYGPFNIWQNITVERTVLTNASGIATMSFRIPWPCEHAEDIVFGTWNVLAKVDIAEESVNDTLTFDVNWIIHLKPGTLVFEKLGTPTDNFNHCDDIQFEFEVNNNGMIDRYVYFTIVVYDELGVPFCEITFYKTIHPGHGYVYIIDYHIPKWAYAGEATAYVNAYTDDPWLCGVPYCPEISGVFLINAA